MKNIIKQLLVWKEDRGYRKNDLLIDGKGNVLYLAWLPG